MSGSLRKGDRGELSHEPHPVAKPPPGAAETTGEGRRARIAKLCRATPARARDPPAITHVPEDCVQQPPFPGSHRLPPHLPPTVPLLFSPWGHREIPLPRGWVLLQTPPSGQCCGTTCLLLPAASASAHTPSERFHLGFFPSPDAAANPKGCKDIRQQHDLPSPPSWAGEDAPDAGKVRELQVQREKGGRKVGDRDGDAGAGLTRYRSTRDVFPRGGSGLRFALG